ncbi:MAG TPA: hypothetical protein VEL75_14360, partial [Candidatus Methylomirabilis sp.]|nr:hypothetical protein [Candidatus Methylomirabilis sp.]
DAQAAELRRRARAAMEAAIKLTKGTVEGYLTQADLHLWDGQLDAAQADLQAAVKLDPRSLEAQEELAQFYAKTGQGDRAEEQWAIARQLIHTTAAPMLRLAWARASKTAWQGTQAALASARQLDPEDARAPAYLGAVMEGDGKPREAVAAYRTALALEEGRLALDEPSSGNVPTRDALDFGLAIQMRLRLGRIFEQAGNRPEALALYEAAASYQPRMARGWEARQMFTAMLPDQPPDRGAAVPAPANAATLMAEANLRAGKVLAAMGRPDEALRHFAAAASLGPRRMAGVPMIGNSRGDTNFGGIAGAPASEAALYVARSLLAKGDPQGASQALYEVGRDLPDQLRGELSELNMAIARESSRMRAQSSATQPDPQAQAYADVQRQRDQERMRTAMRQMSASARVVPELVGVWELTPDNKYLPWQKTLTVDAAANYVLVSKRDGSTARGKMNVQATRSGARGGQESAGGQMMLYDEAAGQIRTMWYEFVDRDVMRITDLDGTKYEARRRP